MIQLTDKVWAVEVPEWANGFKIDSKPEIDFYELDCYEIGEYDEPVKEKSISLPAGSWRYICISKGITEEQAANFVNSIPSEVRGRIYMNYQSGLFAFVEFTDSLNSLLASKGLDNSKQYALIEKM